MDAKRINRPLASAFLAQHKPREALALLTTNAAAAADLPGILVARASGLEQLDDATGAQAALDEAGRLAPKLIDVPLASALMALHQHDWATAERAADRAILIDGRSANALLLKAQVMEQRGQRSGAIDLLTKAAAADPKASRVRLERGRMLISAGRSADAVTEFTRRERAKLPERLPHSGAPSAVHAMQDARRDLPGRHREIRQPTGQIERCAPMPLPRGARFLRQKADLRHRGQPSRSTRRRTTPGTVSPSARAANVNAMRCLSTGRASAAISSMDGESRPSSRARARDASIRA